MTKASKARQELFEKYPEMLVIYNKMEKPWSNLKKLLNLKHSLPKKIAKAEEIYERYDKEWLDMGIKLGIWTKKEVY